jgi:choline dehydrogenase
MHGYRLGAGTMRPASRGRLALTSSDPAATPAIDPNYLAMEDDLRGLRAAFMLARETLAQAAFAPFDGGETDPGPEVRSTAEIDRFIRRAAGSAYHPCGTCRMGAEHDGAVVDPQGRVHGIAGLRVVDASIMPSIVSSNLNLPSMMIGEKLSDAILGRAPPAPADINFHNARARRLSA